MIGGELYLSTKLLGDGVEGNIKVKRALGIGKRGICVLKAIAGCSMRRKSSLGVVLEA